MSTLQVWIEGLGAWSRGLPDWTAWRALLRGEGGVDANVPGKPRPDRLAAGERRRVSLHVLSAIEVASQAVAMSGRDGADLPCIFASAHGDTGIMDYTCATLAQAPLHLSPTRFHNSVHNAAAGYWTIASHCRAGSQAVAGADATFAAGLLEAAVQATVEEQPVLLVAHDAPGGGPVGEALPLEHPFACGLVLSPHASTAAVARLALSLHENTAHEKAPQHAHAATLAGTNPAAHGLILLEALATDAATRITLTAAPHLGLDIDIDINAAGTQAALR